WRNSEDPNAILRNDADILPSQASLFRPSLKEDGVYTDGGMVASRHNNQAAEAIELTKYALNYAHELGKGGKTPEVTVTGHSLGGDLAQVTAHHFGLKGETFNAYGALSLDRRIPEGGTDVINHVMAGDAVSAASKHYGQVKIYASPQEIATLKEAGYDNTRSLLDARNPLAAVQLSDSHKMHNFLPVDGDGKPDRSVLEDPKSQQLAQQYAPMVDKYRDDVALMRGHLTIASRTIQSMNVADGINQLRGTLAPGAGAAEMAAERWKETQQRMQREDTPVYVTPSWKLPLGNTPERCVDPGAAAMSNDPLYRSIHSKLPQGTSDAVAMHATVEAKRAGIVDVNQLRSVTVQDGNAWIVGNTPGFRAKVDLAAEVPPVQDSLRQSQALDSQRSQEMAQPSPARVL
ncbi:lipase family protein, partial [Xanthomonas dyei]|uniref:lipase family protein n=2 Tax=Xanthomonas dyei TaxID=743699 RepID=UPI0011B057D6